MLKKVVIICRDINIDLDKFKAAHFVGVESGTLKLLRERRRIEFACGDFDSVSREELEYIKNNVERVELLERDKDLIDSEYAIKRVISIFNPKEIVLISSGSRLDMTISSQNLLFLYKDYSIHYIDENNEIFFVSKKFNSLSSYFNSYKYVSFLSYEESKIYIEGFKYSNKREINIKPYALNAISNEIINNKFKVDVIKGSVFIFFSK